MKILTPVVAQINEIRSNENLGSVEKALVPNLLLGAAHYNKFLESQDEHHQVQNMLISNSAGNLAAFLFAIAEDCDEAVEMIAYGLSNTARIGVSLYSALTIRGYNPLVTLDDENEIINDIEISEAMQKLIDSAKRIDEYDGENK